MANLPFNCKDCPDRYPGCSGKCEKYKLARAEYDRLKANEHAHQSVRMYVIEKRLEAHHKFLKSRRKLRGYQKFR